jgi:hypothetical protein
MKIFPLLLQGFNEAIIGHVDVFICSASFEKRCLAIPRVVAGRSPSRVLISENQNHIELHGQNPGILRNLFAGRGAMVFGDTGNPLRTADALLAALRDCAGPTVRTVVVDVTAFTHEGLLILLRLLPMSFPTATFYLGYTRAAEYSVGEPLETKWLSRGVSDVRPILGYSGEFIPWRPLHLILLGGFESDRALELIRTLEPTHISLGIARAGESNSEFDVLAMQNIAQIKAIYGGADEFTFHPYSPASAHHAIAERTQAIPAFNVAVAPMSTKLSTIGAALAAIEHEEIQLCYPQAVLYNYLRYSRSADSAFLVQVEAAELLAGVDADRIDV